MADILLRAKSNRPGASEVTLVAGNFAPEKSGYRYMGCDLGNAEWDKIYSGMRGTQGARLASATAQNRLSTWTLEVVGSSQDDLQAKLATLWGLDEELRRFGGTLTWRPQGGSYRMFFEVLDGGVQINGYDRLFHWNNRLTVTLGVVSPPYAECDSYDILDDFSADTLGNYTFDLGAAGNVAIAGGVLTAVANLTTAHNLIHTDRGYTYGDHQVTVKATPGSTITSYQAGPILKRIDVSNCLFVIVIDDGTNSKLQLWKTVANISTQLATVTLARIVNGTPFWVRGRIEGNTVYLEYFTSAPTPMSTPTNSTSYTLTTGEAAMFGSEIEGRAGFRWLPQHAAATLDDFTVEPYTYRNLALPDEIALNGAIAGDAPALGEISVTTSGGASASIWALLAWWQRASIYNRVQNGDFELSSPATGGWAVAAVANINGAATSIARVTTAFKYGTASGEIVAPATADTGASYRIFRRFKKGVTYTAEAWIQSAAGVTNTYIRLGNGAANDKASSANTALSATWQRITVSWTPTADYDDAHVAINIAAATGTTYRIDGVMVYEGTTAPTSANQTEGRGGLPPLGVIEAESSYNITPVSLVTGATYRSGVAAQNTGGVSPMVGNWIIDPSVLVADDQTQDEIAIEFWMRLQLSTTIVSPTVLLSAMPMIATLGATGTLIYPEESGSTPKALVVPTGSSVFRMYRLGTIRFSTRLGRYNLRLQMPFSAGADLTLDYLLAVPMRSRALGPTGKVNDGNYPAWTPYGTEITRKIRSDLSGTWAEPRIAEVPYHGLGGALIEIPPGAVDALVKLSGGVPDDPTAAGSNTDGGATQSATVHFAVTPRVHLGRSS